MKQVIRVGELGEVGDAASENRIKAIAILGVPLVTTMTASYFINKAAYPKDFTALKWLGIPLALAVISGVTFFLTSVAVGPFERTSFTGEDYYG